VTDAGSLILAAALQIAIEREVRLVRKEEYGYLCAKRGKMQSFDQSNDPVQVYPSVCPLVNMNHRLQMARWMLPL
jgi:hypothetical protein